MSKQSEMKVSSTFRTILIVVLILILSSVNTIEIVSAETRDIAVISVTLSATDVEVGDLVNITVVVRNQGTEFETFNLTAYYDTKTIETKTVLDLQANANASLTFVWNTTGTSPGIYSLKAEADPLPQETNAENNALTSPYRVRILVSPYIAIVPGSTADPSLTPGMNYTVSIYTDYNGSDVWGYEFELTYENLRLAGIEVVNGDLITEDVGTTIWQPGTFNNTAGTLSLTGNGFFAIPPATPAVTSGPGTLAIVTFTVVGLGDSFVTLGDETRLIGFNAITEERYNIIDDTMVGHIVNSYFSNVEEVIQDLAIINVSLSTTEVEVGNLINITVFVENQGTVDEDATVKVYWDYVPEQQIWLIDTKTQSLSAGTTKSLVFAWDTSVVPAGNHTITAVANVLPGEEDTNDNVLDSDETVVVTEREEQPIPIDLIIGIAIIAIVAVTVVWYAFKRRRKPKPTHDYS